jgi:hypothetical protein
VFANGSGLDTTFDFENDKDVIDLTGFAGIGDVNDIDDNSSQVGTDVVIDLGGQPAAHRTRMC